jgi:Ca-activated chloride channel family protein
LIKEGTEAPVIIPQPGYLHLDVAAAGYGTILSGDGQVVYKWDQGTTNPSGRFLLQPGDYIVVYRSRSARSMAFSVSKQINIRSGSTTHLSLNG